MKINTKQVLKGFDGTTLKLSETEDMTVGTILSGILNQSQSNKFDPHKKYTLGMKLFNQSEVELDNADKANLIELLKGEKQNALIVGQLIEILQGE